MSFLSCVLSRSDDTRIMSDTKSETPVTDAILDDNSEIRAKYRAMLRAQKCQWCGAVQREPGCCLKVVKVYK